MKPSKPILASHSKQRFCLAFLRESSAGDAWLRHRRRKGTDWGAENVGISEEAPKSLENLLQSENLQPEVKCRILEAILLIAKEPLSARKLASLAGLADPTEARTLARLLNEQYDSVGHAFRIEEIAGGMQFLTRPQFAPWLRRLEHVKGEELLSHGMLETLAITAYRQPLLRAEIEAIRGVSCDEVLRQLMQRDLVRISGRLEELGRPYLYGTTKRFLQLFGLQSLDSLPRAQKIRLAEAEIASRLAGVPNTAQDILEKADQKMGSPDSTSTDHH